MASEAAGKGASGARVPLAVRVSDKLRVSLARFAGPDGFTSLARRALALARAELPVLKTVTVSAEGALEGLDAFAGDDGTEAAVAIVAQLLGLLVAFVGEPLTLRLVRNAWPDVPLNT